MGSRVQDGLVVGLEEAWSLEWLVVSQKEQEMPSVFLPGVRQDSLPLTKPVMAYLALGAYTAAYGAFMFALVVCQDPKMWTIMVWLFDMQNWAPQYLIMTALVLAALPTLIVFVLFQNVIIKGIILPVEQ